MSIHIRKLAAKIEDIEELEQIQAQKLAQYGKLFTYTRNTPQKQQDLLEGGSLYWVIKGYMRCRQEILGFESDVDEEGRKYCLIILKPGLVQTELKLQKAFQGWRYLKAQDAPQDRGAQDYEGDELPDHVAQELKNLGLI